MEHSRTYNISNEHLLLISVLNSMYNDNIQQINNLNQTITQLTDSNRQIMNLLIQMLYNTTNSRRNNLFRPSNVSNSASRLNYRGHHNRPTNVENDDVSNANRVFINNTPYIIDNIQRYNIPRNRSNRTESREGSRDENNRFSRLLESFFQPITVYPTQSQLEAATRIVRYSDITSPLNRSCPISLENFEENDMVTVIRYCGHIFNSDEVNRWFRTNCRCPVCRYDIRNYNPNSIDGLVDTNVNHRINENIPSLSTNAQTIYENNNSQDDELLESGEERNTQLQTTTQPFNINNGSNPSLFLDIILDGFTEENIRDLLRETADISGNFLSSDNSSTTTFSSLINRAFNNSSYR